MKYLTAAALSRSMATATARARCVRGAHGTITALAPLEFDRWHVSPEDVRIDIKFCGAIFNSLNFF
jgi:hypothetical protein